MEEYRFSLAEHRKMICPACGHRTFVPYADNKTGELLDESCGRCDRENNCAYHFTPKELFKEHPELRPTDDMPTIEYNTQQPKQEPQPSYMPTERVRQSVGFYEQNIFAQWLIGVVGKEAAEAALTKYKVGTSEHWNGATVFWQIDKENNTHAGKIMLYGADGHRVKGEQNYVSWAHSVLGIKDYNLKQCLFGEHLINTEDKPVAVVESEKTAILSSIYMPQYIWVATGGSENLRPLTALAGRDVILFPDTKMYEKWVAKTKNIERIFSSVRVSDYLEKTANQEDYEKGVDIADYMSPEFAKQLSEDSAIDKKARGFFDKYYLNMTKKPEQAKTLYQSAEGKVMFTQGNISCIMGPPKSKKTFLTILMSHDYLKANPKGKVMLIDTEQAKNDTYNSISRLYEMLGLIGRNEKNQREPITKIDERIIPFTLREANSEERTSVVESMINMLHPDIIFIDGVRDLVEDFNDVAQSKCLVDKLMKWSSVYGCHICLLIHMNKGDKNARGHLGTEIMNKSETVITVEGKNSAAKCSPEYCRHEQFDTFYFLINQLGLPERCDEDAYKNNKKETTNNATDDKCREELRNILGKNCEVAYSRDHWVEALKKGGLTDYKATAYFDRGVKLGMFHQDDEQPNDYWYY